jgi:hypothetical protein
MRQKKKTKKLNKKRQNDDKNQSHEKNVKEKAVTKEKRKENERARSQKRNILRGIKEQRVTRSSQPEEETFTIGTHIRIPKIKIMKGCQNQKNPLFESKDTLIKTYRDLMLFFYKVVFFRNYFIWEDNRSYPHTNVLGSGLTWWTFLSVYFHGLEKRDDPSTFDEANFESIDIKEQVENIKKYSAIVRRPWSGQTDIVIGCGHLPDNCRAKHHDGQYTVDPDMANRSDCSLYFGNFSLSRVIPEAKGKIKRIILEGIMIEENPCFYKDILYLLEERGYVCDSIGEPMIGKKNNKLFALHPICPGCNEVHVCCEPYRQWTLKVEDSIVEVTDIGSNALGWVQQYDKVMFERSQGLWEERKNPSTPFDTDF